MDWLTILLTILTGALLIRRLLFKKSGRLEELGVIHSRPVPIFGNMARVLLRSRTLHDVVTDTYRLDDRADYVGFYDFGEPVIMIRSPELMKTIAIKCFDHFVDHRGFTDADLDPMFASNLFQLKGDKWREIRNLLSPAFTGSKMKSMFVLMSKCAEDFADYLADRSIGEPRDFDAKDAFTRYTSDVIGTCAFGISIDSMRNPNNDFYVLGRRATDFDGILSIKFFLIRSFPTLSRLLGVKLVERRVEKFFEGIVRDTIETRDREGITRPDMIQLMMETRAKKNDKVGGPPEMTILDMTAQAFIFFFGGFDTTSTIMSFVALQLAVYEEVQNRLMDEIDDVMSKTNGQPTYDAVNAMAYLDAVINETLRLYPILAFQDRVCLRRFELPPALPGGKSVVIEPGQNVWFPVYSIHRDPKYFADPERFDPDRFIGDRKNDIDPSTFFPFGQGPRMCIGNRFALLETKVVIFHLLARCRVTTSDQTVLPTELSKSNFSMSPRGGFRLRLETRKRIRG